MKELKFIEVDNRYEVQTDYADIKVKMFYTLNEKKSLVKAIEEPDKNGNRIDGLTRSFIKVVNTAKWCTNIDFSKCKNDNEIYDICSEHGLIEMFDLDIYDYRDVDKIVALDEDSMAIANKLMICLSGFSDTLQSNVEDSQKKLELISKVAKEDGVDKIANN